MVAPASPANIPSMSSLTLIAAVAQNRVIGTPDGGLPWDIPADLKRFQQLTLGKPVIMGRATFDSIGEPLPGRRNIVITRQTGWTHEGVEVAASIEAALALAGDASTMVIGGGEIYAQTIGHADRLEITWVSQFVLGAAVKFPPIDLRTWHCVESDQHDGHTFASYRRHAA